MRAARNNLAQRADRHDNDDAADAPPQTAPLVHGRKDEWLQIAPGERFVVRISSKDTEGAYTTLEVAADARNGVRMHIHAYAVPMIATEDVGRTVAELLQEDWAGHRIVELEAAERVTPNAIASAFARALGRSVRAEAVPRASWEETFRRDGMRNPLPRMQMVDGFNDGWIDFPKRGGARTGRIGVDGAIAALVRKEAMR